MTEPCRWCGLIHGPRCSLVKAIEYHDDGVTVRRVEFFAPVDYPPLGPPDWIRPVEWPPSRRVRVSPS